MYDNFKLWTIQDAKDGDVLVNGSNIFIFHFLDDTRLKGYCHVNIDDGRFYDDIGKKECFCLIDAVVTPAAKEQRDLLFQKMAEEGYEWNTEKKEVKKIEPNFKVGDWIIGDEGIFKISQYEDDGGYNLSSRTTGSITRILNKYCNQDYEVIDKSNRNFDMWYNTRKYRITLYDYDITTKTSDSNKLFYSRIESVPDNLTSKQFRENYFDNFIQLHHYKRMTKQCFYPPYTWINSKYHCEGGMAYRYCDQHYNHIGVILFEPIRTKLTKRTYLTRI